MPPTRLTLLACVASTLFMTGLIWFVQVVHYPLFGAVAREDFGRYHVLHSQRTTWVVIVPMLVELITSFVLTQQRPAGVGPALAWAGFAAALLTWLSTAFVQVPLHGRLGAGFDPSAHAALVSTNLARALFWTAHAAVVLVMLARGLRDA